MRQEQISRKNSGNSVAPQLQNHKIPHRMISPLFLHKKENILYILENQSLSDKRATQTTWSNISGDKTNQNFVIRQIKDVSTLITILGRRNVVNM